MEVICNLLAKPATDKLRLYVANSSNKQIAIINNDKRSQTVWAAVPRLTAFCQTLRKMSLVKQWSSFIIRLITKHGRALDRRQSYTIGLPLYINENRRTSEHCIVAINLWIQIYWWIYCYCHWSSITHSYTYCYQRFIFDLDIWICWRFSFIVYITF